jgi:hypothetical protein
MPVDLPQEGESLNLLADVRIPLIVNGHSGRL